MTETRSTRTETLALYGSLGIASVAYRFPALLNAATVDSDAAIVGIQARHMLRGELSWFLYGSGYQTSVDSAVAALFFAVLGATSLALMLSTLAGHIALTCCVHATLRPHLRPVHPWAAFVATLPLVLTSTPLHTYILNPPRQAALTLVFVAVLVIDRATGRASRRGRLGQQAAGAALGGLACFADPYALLFFPLLVLLGIATAWDDAPSGREIRQSAGRVVATLVGAALGMLPLYALSHRPGAVHGETTLTLAVLSHNWALLRDTCLPWLLGTTVFVPRALLGYVPWPSGAILHGLALLGAALFLGAIAIGGGAVLRRDLPWSVRRLGGFGSAVGLATLASFLVSVMVMDLFSSRYLAALVLASPLALAPLAFRVSPGRLALLLAPYLASAAVCGWLGYGDAVDGARVVSLPGHGAADEERLGQLLRARGVRYAIADYWVSYRLTFLYAEQIAVVPIHEREDRYSPYRDGFRSASRSAYVFDPKRSREDLASMEKSSFSGADAWGRPVERLQVGPLTAIIFER
jgi:hypothetical protein